MLVNTFPDFERYWVVARRQTLAQQINHWAANYMASWPELFQKQVEEYAAEGLDWRSVAAEHVFPGLDLRWPAMRTACSSVLAQWEPVVAASCQRLGLADGTVGVIYVGIGLGAGWATSYGGRPAVLFGLENMAEEGWVEPDCTSGLIAHELGHLLHFQLRGDAGLTGGSGPWWQLYEEGFAMVAEQLIMDTPSWHFMADYDPIWLDWCRAHRGWLAAEFLRRVADDPAGVGEGFRPFFGSWYELAGHKQTGYYLGWEVVQQLLAEQSLTEVARLDDLTTVENLLRKFV